MMKSLTLGMIAMFCAQKGLSQTGFKSDSIRVTNKNLLENYLRGELKTQCPEIVLKRYSSSKTLLEIKACGKLEFIESLRGENLTQQKRKETWVIITGEHLYVF